MDIETIAQQFYDYSRYIKGYSKATVKGYEATIRFFCRYSRMRNIEDVTERTVRDFFLNGRAQRQWKPLTFVKHHATMIVFFRWCVRQGYLAANPAAGIEVPKAGNRLPPKLTQQAALRLLETALNYPYRTAFVRNRNHAIYATFLYAGLRKGELLRLRLADVDITNMTIFVSQGKGDKDRVVPISFTLATILTRYANARTASRKTCPEFFASSTGNAGLSNDGLLHVIRQVREASNIRHSAHKLRHTFATLMLEGGCDIYSLSRMMGHSNIKTTTIYLAASAEHLRAQMTKHPLNAPMTDAMR